MNTFIFYSYYYSSRSLPQENLGGCGCCQSRVTLVTVCPFQQGTLEVETFQTIKVRSVFLCIHKAVKEQRVSSNLPPCRRPSPPEPRAERVTAREPEQDSGQPDPRLGEGEGGLLQHRGQARPERRRQDRHGGRDRAHGPQRRADQRRILIIVRTIL